MLKSLSIHYVCLCIIGLSIVRNPLIAQENSNFGSWFDVELQNNIVQQGDTIFLSVYLTTAYPITGYGFDLTYDNGLVEYITCTDTKFLSQYGSSTFNVYNDIDSARIITGESLLKNSAKNMVLNKPNMVGTFLFRANNSGMSSFNFNNEAVLGRGDTLLLTKESSPTTVPINATVQLNDTSRFTIDAPDSIALGDTLTVQISLSAYSDLSAYGFDLEYSGNSLLFLQSEQVIFTNESVSTSFQTYHDVDLQSIIVGESTLNASESMGKSVESQVMCSFQFLIKETEIITLNLKNEFLLQSSGKERKNFVTNDKQINVYQKEIPKTRLKLLTQNTQVDKGDTMLIHVAMDNSRNSTGYAFDLNYYTPDFRVLSVQKEELFHGYNSFFSSFDDSINGKIIIGESILGNASYGVSYAEMKQLCTIKLLILHKGISNIFLSDVSVIDKNIFDDQIIYNDTIFVNSVEPNSPPIANAGIDVFGDENEIIYLDGSDSFDPDGDAINYHWISLNTLHLEDAFTAKPYFMSPEVKKDSIVSFTLSVDDRVLLSVLDTVSVTIQTVNKNPVANAGKDFMVSERKQVTLDGSNSYDPDGDNLFYLWESLDGLMLNSLNIGQPKLQLPSIEGDTVFYFSLQVSDGFLYSNTDTVKITVLEIDTLSTETQIIEVKFAELDSANIDSNTSEITFFLPYGTDIRNVSPMYTVSPGATLYPPSGTQMSLVSPQQITVTAEDGITKKKWLIKSFEKTAVYNRGLDSGWNWISLNITPESNNIEHILSSVQHSENDYISTSTGSTLFLGEGLGWFGELQQFPQQGMVQYYKSNEDNLTIEGTEINPIITSISVYNGWNELAYLLAGDVGINDAFMTTTLFDTTCIIKSKSASAIYYPSSGWMGDLQTLQVLEGYKLKVNKSGIIKYAPNSLVQKQARLAERENNLYSTYGLNPNTYKYSALFIGELSNLDGTNMVTENQILIAEYLGITRGVTTSIYVPALQKNIFIANIFSNQLNETIDVQFYSGPDSELLKGSYQLSFFPDSVYGLPYEPVKVKVSESALQSQETKDTDITLFPNVVHDQIFRVLADTEIKQISIYSLSGSLVKVEYCSGQNVSISTNNLSDGVYIVVIKTAINSEQKRIVISGR